MTTFYNAPTVLLLVLCALVVGACFGWLVRGSRSRTFAPERRQQVEAPLKTQVYDKPAAPPRPIWEEDPFFTHPDTLGDERDDIEHVRGVVAGNVVPLYSGRHMG
jgi:hypothetical protein